jgi:hypothetical protein
MTMMIDLKNFKAWISGVKEEPFESQKKTFPPRPDYLCSFNEWVELTQFSSLNNDYPIKDLSTLKRSELKKANPDLY